MCISLKGGVTKCLCLWRNLIKDIKKLLKQRKQKIKRKKRKVKKIKKINKKLNDQKIIKWLSEINHQVLNI